MFLEGKNEAIIVTRLRIWARLAASAQEASPICSKPCRSSLERETIRQVTARLYIPPRDAALRAPLHFRKARGASRLDAL